MLQVQYGFEIVKSKGKIVEMCGSGADRAFSALFCALGPVVERVPNQYYMFMYHTRIESAFSAAHHLTHYNGKCERQHGHNYKINLWARGGKLDEGGMLVDFGRMKSALKEVLAILDHQDLNELGFFGADPSAERIAEFIFNRVRENNPELPICAVDVFETDTSMARFSLD